MHLSFRTKQQLVDFNHFLKFYTEKYTLQYETALILLNLFKKKVTARVLLQLTSNWIKMGPHICRLIWFNLGLIRWKLFAWLFFWTNYFAYFRHSQIWPYSGYFMVKKIMLGTILESQNRYITTKTYVFLKIITQRSIF